MIITYETWTDVQVMRAQWTLVYVHPFPAGPNRWNYSVRELGSLLWDGDELL